MAKNSKSKSTPADLERTSRDKAVEWFMTQERTPEHLIPEPTRMFTVGETVAVGNLTNCVIDEILYCGKAYVIKHDPIKMPRGRPTPVGRRTIVQWWFDIDKVIPNGYRASQPMFEPYVGVQLFRTDLRGVFHHMNSGGLVCDPTYQRKYVWSQSDRDALLDSVVERLELGTIVLLRNHGYTHLDDHTVRTYITIDQRLVQLEACDDNAVVIIDGQQRLTTLYNFWCDRFMYRGLYFSQWNRQDQADFENTAITTRLFEEPQTTRKQLLKIFLQVNRGVPQSTDHLAEVQKMYDNEQ